jgi:hypothetical protein
MYIYIYIYIYIYLLHDSKHTSLLLCHKIKVYAHIPCKQEKCLKRKKYVFFYMHNVSGFSVWLLFQTVAAGLGTCIHLGTTHVYCVCLLLHTIAFGCCYMHTSIRTHLQYVWLLCLLLLQTVAAGAVTCIHLDALICTVCSF